MLDSGWLGLKRETMGNNPFACPLGAGLAAAAFLLLSGCVTYPYQSAFAVCDNDAAACYRYCEQFSAYPGDYGACHADCEAEANSCFAEAYDAYSYSSGSVYASSSYGWPWYGRYGYWGPSSGYYFDFTYFERYPRYSQPRRGWRYRDHPWRGRRHDGGKGRHPRGDGDGRGGRGRGGPRGDADGDGRDRPRRRNPGGRNDDPPRQTTPPPRRMTAPPLRRERASPPPQQTAPATPQPSPPPQSSPSPQQQQSSPPPRRKNAPPVRRKNSENERDTIRDPNRRD